MTSAAPTAAVWLRPDQLELVRTIADIAGLRVVAAGTGVPGRSSELAQAFDAEPLTDLRNALAASKASIVVLASADALGDARPAEDAQLLRAAGERGVGVLSLEPVPASIVELSAGDPGIDLAGDPGSTLGRWARFCPLSRATRALRDAHDVVAQFGPPRAAVIECLGAPAHGTLGARFLDALDLGLNLLGSPETIEASFTGAQAGQAVHTLPGETLRDLQGDITAHLRLADGRACSILASNQAGRWERVITLIGAQGRLRIYNDGFEWISISGEKVDQSRSRRSPRSAFKPPTAKDSEITAPSGFASAVVEQIDALLRLGRGDTSSPAPDMARLLAIGQAGLLSARTGEGESPATLLRMGGMSGV